MTELILALHVCLPLYFVIYCIMYYVLIFMANKFPSSRVFLTAVSSRIVSTSTACLSIGAYSGASVCRSRLGLFVWLLVATSCLSYQKVVLSTIICTRILYNRLLLQKGRCLLLSHTIPRELHSSP